MRRWLAAAVAALPCAVVAAERVPDPSTAIHCGSCANWNRAQAPFRIHGRSWYVGPQGLSVLLVDSGDGLVLLDGALPQSVPAIAAALREIGFGLDQVRWILVSHAHYDHVGGIAALQAASGARVAASPLAASALRAGTVPDDDPQAAFGEAMRFAPIVEVVEIADGESIRLGELEITALHTPGHTPGGSSWYWTSCEEASCVRFLYADSLTAVSADGFRFSDEPARIETFRRSIGRVRELDCGLLVSTHPAVSGLFERHAAAATDGPAAFLEAQACRRYADAAERGLQRRLEAERAALDAHP